MPLDGKLTMREIINYCILQDAWLKCQIHQPNIEGLSLYFNDQPDFIGEVNLPSILAWLKDLPDFDGAMSADDFAGTLEREFGPETQT